MSNFYSIQQSGLAILNEINRVSELVTVYRFTKPFLSGRDQKDLNDLENTLGNILDPLSTARNVFLEWNTQCDLELLNFKKTEQIRVFEREKKMVTKLLNTKKRDYPLLAAKMKSVLLALEIVERTSSRKELPYSEKIPTNAIEVIHVEKGQQFTALKRIEGIFMNAEGYLKLMDNWVDERTLDFIVHISPIMPVKILTSKIQNKTKFETGFKRLCEQRNQNLELRINTPSDFHDRYIISQNDFWISGQSLKDIGLKKFGIVARIGNTPEKQSVERKFDEIWNRSKGM